MHDEPDRSDDERNDERDDAPDDERNDELGDAEADDDGDDGDDDDGDDDPIDWATLSRRYEIALADFRLDRGHVLWPAVAGAVDAAFLICDPLGVLSGNALPAAWRMYERAAARVWAGLWAAMLDSIGIEPDVLVLQRLDVHNVVREVIEDEFGDHDGVSGTVADERQFADIIHHAFDVSLHATLSSIPVDPTEPDAAPRVRDDRVELMVSLLTDRLARFPWSSDEPF